MFPEQFFQQLNPESVKIFGSWVRNQDISMCNDIDIAVDMSDEDTVSRVLKSSSTSNDVVKLNPLFLPPDQFNDLENCMTWSSDCMVLTLDRGIVYGKPYSHSMHISFNPKSVESVFCRTDKIEESYKKKRQQGFQISDRELARMRYFSTNEIRHLTNALHAAIGDKLVNFAKCFNGIIAGGVFRSIIEGKPVKDVDIFTTNKMTWNAMCNYMKDEYNEIEVKLINTIGGGPFNVRQFDAGNGLIVDVILYNVCTEIHPVDLFDFTMNMMWFNTNTNTVCGSAMVQPHTIVDHILQKRIVINPDAWMIGSVPRLLKRIKRFTDDGYVVNGRERITLRNVVSTMLRINNGKHTF